MMPAIALIGFGEAASTFARAGGWSANTRAFDIDPACGDAMAALGVTRCDSLAEALSGAALVLSLVTADAAFEVARDCASLIARDALFCDMNSVAPGTKHAAAQVLAAVGRRYVDVAVMAPVDPLAMAVPLILSGADAPPAQALLAAAGFSNIRLVGDEIGRASTIKMLRSVMVKGVEALTAECLIACERAGVTDDVLESFGSGATGDWANSADYRLDRMLIHGLRRAAELREVCRTVADLGFTPGMSTGTVAWQQAMGELGLNPPPAGLAAKLAAIADALPADAKFPKET